MENLMNLEEKEIRGINFKLIRYLIIGTVTIVVVVLGTYFKLQNSIHDINQQKAGDDKYNELRLKSIETNIQFLQKQIDGLNAQVNK